MPSELTKLLRRIDEAEWDLKIHKRKVTGLVIGNFLLITGGTIALLFVPPTNEAGGHPIAAAGFSLGVAMFVFNIVMGAWVSATWGAAKQLRDARYAHIDFLEDQDV